ncbi:zinc finger protein on ecdysone puffs-like isoform X2 [Palaemon carinicauda]|uniref:zinc finger protein on ecdysone puffs-like isoform X2 n=1 Tax=Palaemon carinicauda TaxID=392227 RepID=UPI0035B61A71
MSGFFQRNRGQFRGQNAGGSNFNPGSFQAQGNMGRQQMMNPWQTGIMPVGGGIQSGRTDEAALAFNILNQVLASDTPMMNTGMNQGSGFQDRKGRQGLGGRLEDRRRGQSPQFSNRNRGDGGRQWSNRSRSPHGRDNRQNQRRDGVDRNRKSVLERLGKVPEKNRASKERSKERTPFNKRRKSKDRQSSEDKSFKGKDADSDKKKEEMAEDKMMDKENEEQVVKALKCHVCEMDSFESIENFRNHKKSDEHKLFLDIYNQRSEAALQLMRADAKLSANREREKSGNANRESFYTRCPKCDCIVADAFKSHKKSIEHELVDNHVFRECCGSTFIRRREFEDHRLTIPHLKRQMETKTDNPLEEKVVMAFGGEEELASATLREFKDKHRLDLESPADFPEYDPEKPIGLGYVHKKRRYNCTVCNKSFPSYNNMALAHCRSFNHYLMLMTHLEGKLKEVEDEEMPEVDEEEDTEEKDEEETVKEEEENADEAIEASGPADENEENDKEKTDNNEEEEEKENEQAEADEEMAADEDIAADDEMGETMPPLDEGTIDLEEKAIDDEETALEPDNEPEEELREEDTKDDPMSNDEQEEDEPVKDEKPEVESKTEEETGSSEATKEEETAEKAENVEVEQEQEVEVKRRPSRARRARVMKHF